MIGNEEEKDVSISKNIKKVTQLHDIIIMKQALEYMT